jgi:hypothetical protein
MSAVILLSVLSLTLFNRQSALMRMTSLMRDGRIAMEENDFDEAIEIYRLAVSLNERSVEAYIRLAAACIYNGDFEDAQYFLELGIRKTENTRLREAYNDFLRSVALLEEGFETFMPFTPEEPPPPPPEETVSETVWIRPDGHEFARGLGFAYGVGTDVRGTRVIQFWDTGERVYKFEKYIDQSGRTMLIIDGSNAEIDFRHELYFIHPGGNFILIGHNNADIHGIDLHFLEHDGQSLLRIDRLDGGGMVICHIPAVEEDTVIMGGTRITEGPGLLMSDLSVIDLNDEAAAALVDSDEIVQAVYSVGYVGGGQFSEIEMTGDEVRFALWYEEWLAALEEQEAPAEG